MGKLFYWPNIVTNFESSEANQQVPEMMLKSQGCFVVFAWLCAAAVLANIWCYLFRNHQEIHIFMYVYKKWRIVRLSFDTCSVQGQMGASTDNESVFCAEHAGPDPVMEAHTQIH